MTSIYLSIITLNVGTPGWFSWLSHLTSAQVMIWGFLSLSTTSGSVLSAQSQEPTLDSLSPSLSAPCLLHCLSKINIKKNYYYYFKCKWTKCSNQDICDQMDKKKKHKKNKKSICCLPETNFTPKDTYRLKAKGWKKNTSCKWKQKKRDRDSNIYIGGGGRF